MWIPADVVLVASFPSNRRFFNEIIACVVLRIVLQDNAFFAFEVQFSVPGSGSAYVLD